MVKRVSMGDEASANQCKSLVCQICSLRGVCAWSSWLARRPRYHCMPQLQHSRRHVARLGRTASLDCTVFQALPEISKICQPHRRHSSSSSTLAQPQTLKRRLISCRPGKCSPIFPMHLSPIPVQSPCGTEPQQECKKFSAYLGKPTFCVILSQGDLLATATSCRGVCARGSHRTGWYDSQCGVVVSAAVHAVAGHRRFRLFGHIGYAIRIAREHMPHL